MSRVRTRKALIDRILPIVPLLGCGAALFLPLMPIRDPWFHRVAAGFVAVCVVVTLLGWCRPLRAHLTWCSCCVVLSFWLVQYHLEIDYFDQSRLMFDQRHIDRMDMLRDELENRRWARDTALRVIGSNEFVNTRLSGSEVVSIARATATKDGDNLNSYGDPQIALRSRNGRVVWQVSFYHIPRIPGMFFTVEIDDESKRVTVHPGM